MFDPRLPSSTRWTDLPPALCQQIQEALTDIFSGVLKDHQILVLGRLYPEEVCLSIGLTHPKRLVHHHFQLSWDPTKPKIPLTQQIYLGADELQALILEFLDKAFQWDLPKIWTPMEKVHPQLGPLFFRYNSTNRDIERQADEFLKKHNRLTWSPLGSTDSFVGGDWETTPKPESSEPRDSEDSSS